MSDTFFELDSEGHAQEIDIYTGEVVRKEQSVSDLMLPTADKSLVTNPHLKYRYNEKWARIIAQLYMEVSLDTICKKDGFPSLGVINRWRAEHSEFDEALDMARKYRAESYEDRIHDMATSEEALEKEQVAGVKAKFDMLKWLASVNNRERYGQNQNARAGEGGVTIVLDTGIRRNEDIEIQQQDYEEVANEK